MMITMKSFHNAQKAIVDWIKFDSKLESDYYVYLKWNKDVSKIELQPAYILQPSSKQLWLRAITYVADFYVEYNNWHKEVVDVKWMPTEVSKLKRKLYLYKYPDLKLVWLCKYKWERVDYFENQKRIKQNKKDKVLD